MTADTSGHPAGSQAGRPTLLGFMSVRLRLVALLAMGVGALVVTAVAYQIGTQRQEAAADAAGYWRTMVTQATQAREDAIRLRLSADGLLVNRTEAAIAVAAGYGAGALTALATVEDPVLTPDQARAGVKDGLAAFALYSGLLRDLGLTENDGLSGQLRQSVHQIEAELSPLGVPDLMVSMLMLRRHEKDFMLRGDAKYLARVDAQVAVFRTQLAESALPEETRTKIGALLTAYQRDVQAYGAKSLDLAAARTVMTGRLSGAVARLETMAATATERAAAADMAAEQVAATTQAVILGVAVAAGVALLVLEVLIGRSIIVPLNGLSRATMTIARGGIGVVIPARANRDEIGAMARALETLRGEVDEAFRLRQMVEIQPAEVMVCDPDTFRIRYVNGAARRLMDRLAPALGGTAGDLAGRSFLEVNRDPLVTEGLLRDPEALPYRGKVRVGETTLDVTINAIRDRAGAYLGPMVSWRDTSRYEALVETFETKVRGVARDVGSACVHLTGLAGQMDSATRVASDRSRDVARSAGQASGNVADVVRLSQDILEGISDIAGRAGSSVRISEGALETAAETRQAVDSLARASNRIGEVVALITDIAGKTNLLALNATIEAARAGDVGKGFAVVANEVKQLAAQTAQATEDISAQIGAVQQASQGVVVAITGIGSTISEISTLASQILDAVQAQEAATRSIVATMEDAAGNTRQVNESVAEVADVSQTVGDGAGQILSAVQALGARAETLQQEVDGLLSEMQDHGEGQRQVA